MEQINVSILGGGIAGLSTAISLERIGIKATLFESSPQVRALGAGLVLAANAIKALDVIGIREDIIGRGQVFSNFMLKEQFGQHILSTNQFIATKQTDAPNIALHRADLQEYLIAQIDPNAILLGKKLIDAQVLPHCTNLIFEDGSKYQTDFLIVADGIHSLMRQKLVPNSLPRYAGYTCWRAVIDNSPLQYKTTSETWGVAGRFGIVPLTNDRLYWYACVNSEQNSAVFRDFKVADLKNRFRDYHDPIKPILDLTSDSSLIWSDIMDIKPIARFAFNNTVLIGDAAHATTPNMGQGACQAIEDAVILAGCVQKYADMPKAFQAFEKQRINRTHWITNQSRQMGKIAQWENEYAVKLRNALFRLIPNSMNLKRNQKITGVTFDPLHKKN